MNDSNYQAKNIQVLEGLDAVRLRPGMYIGTTGAKGLHHILWEIVDNAIDEVANGYADTIEIIINADGSASVEDNGRGIPVDMHPTKHKTGVELVFGVLHAGGKFDNAEYKFSGGLHGVGASVTNALSEWLTVEIYRLKQIHYIEFHSPTDAHGKVHSGVLKTPLEITGKTKKTGTKVTFMPDKRVFGAEQFDYISIKNKVRELAFLNKGLHITLKDLRILDANGLPKNPASITEEERQAFQPRVMECKYDGGIADYVSYLNEAKVAQHKRVVLMEKSGTNFEVALAFQYTDSYDETIVSFVNNIPTPEGGTHETGFKSAFTRCMNDYARKRKFIKDNGGDLQGEDFRVGMTAVLAIKMQNVQFEGQTKTKLGNPEVKGIVQSLLSEELDKFLADPKNKEIADLIGKIGVDSCKVREAEKRAKQAQREKNALTGSVLIGKFAACSGRRAEENELFIVEGDSAGGSAKQGRDRAFQAVLPLKGKPLNVEKRRYEQVIGNDEIKTIIYALGADCGKDFELDKLKFGKVIILADADQDGAHIRSILLTFFYRYMREMIREGKVFVGMPPLYKVQKKDLIKYAYDDPELDKITAELKTGYTIQRYKGLGEMNPTQLWDTTLNPRTRTLMRVTLEDIGESDRMVATLMGDNVEARKAFIYENANFNKVDSFAKKYS